MPRMLDELKRKNSIDTGFLGAEFSLGTIVQYWRSFEHLEAYAKDRSGLHYPAWKEFNTKIKRNGDVGIWHETPPKGLGKVGELIPISGKLETAGSRIKKQMV